MSIVTEIGSVHDQRGALPVTTRITHPLTDCGRKVGTAVERDDPGVVDHLGIYRNVIARLENLVVVVIAGGRHRRASGRPQDAADWQAEVFGSLWTPSLDGSLRC